MRKDSESLAWSGKGSQRAFRAGVHVSLNRARTADSGFAFSFFVGVNVES